MKAKPFIKWVGGKGQLLAQLDELLPADFGKLDHLTYIEPFIGGGAMLFYMLQRYPNIEHAVINDINPDLINCYQIVRDCPEKLIKSLEQMGKTYYELRDEEQRKKHYLKVRDDYNVNSNTAIERAAQFIFLNRTCFNGLYRVNRKGKFNVPFGRYANPKIVDCNTILADSELLKRVEILNGDYATTLDYAKGKSFFYFDPPYRPLSDTSSFNDYTKEAFNDEQQIRLKEFCDSITNKGYQLMLSNSDSGIFFDDLYSDYSIDRVLASRAVNANPEKRGKLTEIVVHNYTNTKKSKTNTLKLVYQDAAIV